MDSGHGAILGLFFHLEIEEVSISENKKNYGNTRLSSSKGL